MFRVFAAAALCCCAWHPIAAQPAPLRTLQAIHALSNADASRHPLVDFEATVTYYRPEYGNLFVQDGGSAIYVVYEAGKPLAIGDRIRIRGLMRPSFRPIVENAKVTLLHHGELPRAAAASYEQLIRFQRDAMRVSVRGVVRGADLVHWGDTQKVILELSMDGGYVKAVIESMEIEKTRGMVDAAVEVTGVAAGTFDGKMDVTGIEIATSSMADVRVLKPAGQSPESLPVTPMSDILGVYRLEDERQRIHVRGVITYSMPGSAVVLQSGPQSIWVATESEVPLHLGHLADATGLPNLNDGFLSLSYGKVTEAEGGAPANPVPATWENLDSGAHVLDLVSVEGRVVTSIRQSMHDEFVLVSDGNLFSAVFQHPEMKEGIGAQPMKAIAAGSRVRVTGICVLAGSDPADVAEPFKILMRSTDDIALIEPPSPLNVRNLLAAVSTLVVLVILVLTRSWLIERRVRRQTAAGARIELQRSRILEDINGTRPLVEIVREITELVSARLEGAPCWCQIIDGAQVGDKPATLGARRPMEAPIPGRSGSPLGTLSVAMEAGSQGGERETEALLMGTELATLAIETRRLYSDLLHRSEFDQLTDLFNRFSLEGQLEKLIERAREDASIFGLIYLDLDDFKQVNDIYGHSAGDSYLYQISQRMKKQLRGGDILARLGGDEFAVLVPNIRSRAEAEEIAQRIERCFDEPIALDGELLRGSASVGLAVYPEDAATGDDLLRHADAAMYVMKHRRAQSPA